MDALQELAMGIAAFLNFADARENGCEIHGDAESNGEDHGYGEWNSLVAEYHLDNTRVDI